MFVGAVFGDGPQRPRRPAACCHRWGLIMKKGGSSQAGGVRLSQPDLYRIFQKLCAGGSVEGWGYSTHLEFDTLFNSQGRLWRRERRSLGWVEVRDNKPSG